MQCSCPDWATPCKHLAAIIYKLSAEIDNNPFMVFQLHKVDLPKELEKENIHIRRPAGNDEVPLLLDELVMKAKKAKEGKDKRKQKETRTRPVFSRSNFSTLADITDALVQPAARLAGILLQQRELPGKYALALHKAVRNAQRIILGKTSLQDHKSTGFDAKYGTGFSRKEAFAISHHNNPRLRISADNTLEILVDNAKSGVSAAGLLEALWQVPPAQLPDYQPALLHSARHCCYASTWSPTAL